MEIYSYKVMSFIVLVFASESSMHFELIFMCGKWKGPNLILLHIDFQLPVPFIERLTFYIPATKMVL